MTNSPQLLALACWRLKDAHRRFWRIFMTVAMMAAFALLILRGNAENPHKNFSESHKALVALAPEPVPDAENAALDYDKAFKAFVPWSGVVTDNPINNLRRNGAYFETAAITAFMIANAATYAHIEAGVAKSRCNWNEDYQAGFTSKTDIFSSTLRCTQLLSIRARVRAHAGDHQGAAQDLERLNALAAHIECDGWPSHSFTTIFTRNWSLNALQAIIIHDTPVSARDIEAYRHTIQAGVDPSKALVKWVDNSIVFIVEFLDRAADQNGDALKMINAMRSRRSSPPFMLNVAYASERQTLIDAMKEIRNRVLAGKYISPREDEILSLHPHGPAVVTSEWIRDWMREPSFAAEHANSLLCADAALAVMLFRAKNGRVPKTLIELVPEFLPVVPVDWISKKPLNVVVDENEIELGDWQSVLGLKMPAGSLRVYSFGENGVDDQGHGYNTPEIVKSGDMRDDEAFFVPLLKK